MDPRLADVAQAGDVDALYALLQQNLHILDEADKEIANLKRSFASKLNQDGFSPIHLAVEIGQVEMVRELLALNPNLCVFRGREKRTPLHSAAIAGNIEIINLLLPGSPRCIVDVTSRKETTLHLAVKNNQLDSFKILLEWLQWLRRVEEFCDVVYGYACDEIEVKDFTKIRDALRKIKTVDLLNSKDEEGNTILQLMIEALIGKGITGFKVDVNAKNKDGLTALDIFSQQQPRDQGDEEIEAVLRKAGALNADQIVTPLPPSPMTIPRIKVLMAAHSRSVVRNWRKALLMTAVLIATVCFLTIVNPPGGLWQDNYQADIKNASNGNMPHEAGTATRATGTGIVVFSIISDLSSPAIPSENLILMWVAFLLCLLLTIPCLIEGFLHHQTSKAEQKEGYAAKGSKKVKPKKGSDTIV
ncbi:Ankyrin repeat [Dillenia turbinata]|uniref:Ankyrin repeat n=1 Tax=Dillenia turbinata TaxID=194707 RepID=A0AAN8VX31_9MAGN